MRWLHQALDVLFPPRESELLVRAASIDALTALIQENEHMQSEFSIIRLLPYTNPLVRAAVIEAKFHRNTKAQRMLANVLKEYLISFTEEYALADVRLVPIPLSKERKRARGYNQVTEITKYAEIPLSIAPGVLTRVRDTKPQTSLTGHERLNNMRNAFVAAPVENHTYIVLDDVTTTGATLVAAGKALKEAGAEHITLLALAH